MNPEIVIDALRRSDKYIKAIYTQGSCYQFYLFLKVIFPQSVPFITITKDHIASEIDGELFDITGIIEKFGYQKLAQNEIKMVEKWSFSRSSFLSLGECQYCEEPILIGVGNQTNR